MERKDFLKKGLAGIGSVVAIPVIFDACKKDNSSSTSTCTTSPSETTGPFPTKTPAQLVQANIKSDRTGVALLITLTIQNKNNHCAALQGAVIDIWHCDKEGNYSEYGGSGMQAANYTGVDFLRGRQSTDANGQVSFITIFPGWYSGRAPHLHVQIFNGAGSSLLVTQIAFPTSATNVVYASSLYAARGHADTTNAADNVFSDSLADELATVTGNVTDGYILTKTIVVSG